MLNDLIFCLNATVPIFFLILLGMFLRKIQLMDDAFTARLNTLVFRVCLPALLFHDMYRTDYRTNWNTAYVVYCALATLASILICTGVSYLLKDRSIQGEFIQTSYRSSATILGIAVVQNLYHNVGMAPLMVIGAVPIYNIAAVIILEMYRPDRGKMDAILLRKTLHGILTNPIIRGSDGFEPTGDGGSGAVESNHGADAASTLGDAGGNRRMDLFRRSTESLHDRAEPAD